MTDANLMLGRLDSASFLGGAVGLDRNARWPTWIRRADPLPAWKSLQRGFCGWWKHRWRKAIRVISVERGYDPR